jgi:hypothetical protein
VNPPTTTTTTTVPPPPPVDDTLLPAGMPSEAPDELVPCETSSRIAKVWLKLNGETSSPWAAFNPCDQPLLIAWGSEDEGASSDRGVVVGPGARFHQPHGPVADHGGARLETHLVQCWEEGPLRIMLAGAEEWVRPSCEPDDSDTALSGLPPGEPTHVLPCEDSSGETARVWYYGPESDVDTWGAQNPCEDYWIVIELPGDSVSDPYGAALSIAPGAQFHHMAEGFTTDSPGGERVRLSSGPLDGTGRCPVGFALYELRPEHDGRFERIGSCPNADDLGWYDDEEEEEDGPTCFGHAPNVFGTEGDDVFPNQDTREADQPWYIVGLGGNDTLDLGEPDSGTPDVYFCGGEGDDTAIGMYDGFDGGPGEDTAVSHCGGTIKEVEHVTSVGCSDDLP